jgi:hypothetical protein
MAISAISIWTFKKAVCVWGLLYKLYIYVHIISFIIIGFHIIIIIIIIIYLFIIIYLLFIIALLDLVSKCYDNRYCYVCSMDGLKACCFISFI